MSHGIVQKVLGNSSWDALRQSGVSSTVDIEIIFSLSKLFKLQAMGVESSVQRIIDIISSPDFSAQENLNQTTLLVRNGFRELAGQEVFLVDVYEDAIAKIEQISH